MNIPTTTFRACVLSCCLMFYGLLPAAAAVPEPPVSYDRDIRPILSDKCFRCHGPDAEARQADLRLDTREGLMEHVVVPDKTQDSELIARISSEDPDVRMPPPDSNLSLSPQQKALLHRWIELGAAFSEHWSFQPLPQTVPVPVVNDQAWPRETLDHFVLARLEMEQLKPALHADHPRLLRRLTLDLTGLLPTADECRQFEKAAAENLNAAIEQAVDRLLASPAFGEHMAVAWLDAARYADSYGYQSDMLNTQWPYRDWVVRALNDNLPYDKFLTWQIAGDLLENPTTDQVLATAFNRLHRLTNEGGSIAEEWLVENAADRIHTLSTAVLGLTLECARCHDHKYDPITMRDYYSLFAFFNSIDENGMYDFSDKVPSPSLLLPTAEQQLQLDAARREIADAEAALTRAVQDGGERFDSWLAGSPKVTDLPDLVGYFPFDGPLDEIPNQAPNTKNKASAAALQSVAGIRGKAVRFDGDNGVVFPEFFQIDRWDDFTLDFWLRDTARNPQPVVVLQRTYGSDVGFNGIDVMLAAGFLELRFYRVWPGNGIGVRTTELLAQNDWQHLTVSYDGSSRAAGLRVFLNGRELPTTVLRDRMHKSAASPAWTDGQFTLGARFRDRGFKDGELDEFHVYDRALTPLEIRNLHGSKGFDSAIADAESHGDALRSLYFSAFDADARELAKKLHDARRKLVEVENTIQEVPVMEELPEPRPAHILARGAYDAPKTDANRVERNTFSDVLIPFPDTAPRSRLGLAQWLTDPRHPLTARVMVNRIWSNFFDRGLVTTPENFGRQGATPTHAELLDWLARDFVDHGWDIKRLCRAIVLSSTYQQDSRCSPELRERDPENSLLARGPSRRLSAEQIRDAALAASGLIESRLGGPSVAPYQPGGDLWRETNTMSPAYVQSTGRDLYRRSLYSVWKRTAPLPNMLAFDAGTREVCTVSRGRTNTPLQALVLLNDVQFVEAARALATAVARDHDEIGDQICEAFLRLTGRQPDDRELQALTEIYHEQQQLFADANQQDAAKFLGHGEAKLDSTLAPAELAALAVTCQAILNLDATIYER